MTFVSLHPTTITECISSTIKQLICVMFHSARFDEPMLVNNKLYCSCSKCKRRWILNTTALTDNDQDMRYLEYGEIKFD